jgi:hypothetical protein
MPRPDGQACGSLPVEANFEREFYPLPKSESARLASERFFGV